MKNVKTPNDQGEPQPLTNAKPETTAQSAVGSTVLLGHVVVSSEKQSVTLPVGEKIPVIASDWKHAESLYSSMSQDHREVCRIVVGQSRQEYLPFER